MTSLTADNTVFVLVDVQGRLATLMHDKQTLFHNLQKLLKSLQRMNVPVIWLEQMPEAIGATFPAIAELIENNQPVSKHHFSAWHCPDFVEQLESIGAKNVLIAGIEAHVCVYQTAKDLHQQGYHVQVVADAIASRVADNKRIALARMQQLGLSITGTEMAIFELLHSAHNNAFKDVIKIIK